VIAVGVHSSAVHDKGDGPFAEGQGPPDHEPGDSGGRVPAILAEGLSPMARRQVHLSADPETGGHRGSQASEVGIEFAKPCRRYGVDVEERRSRRPRNGHDGP
jgi:RNA:NAD 2'-phosphotransferase (TPT1/KptA family)